METVLYLCHGIPTTMPLPLATANKLCFSSRRSSSLSLCCGHKKILRARVIECNSGGKLERQASFKSTGTRLGALKSLLDVMTCLVSHPSYTPSTQDQLPTLDSEDKSEHSVNEFKKNVALQMEPEKAIKILEEEYQKYCEEDPHIRFHLDIALVETLICQERFEEALKRDCLKESHPSDLRLKLYKAIIHTMLAHHFWQEFWSSEDIPDALNEIPIKEIEE